MYDLLCAVWMDERDLKLLHLLKLQKEKNTSLPALNYFCSVCWFAWLSWRGIACLGFETLIFSAFPRKLLGNNICSKRNHLCGFSCLGVLVGDAFRGCWTLINWKILCVVICVKIRLPCYEMFSAKGEYPVEILAFWWTVAVLHMLSNF